MRPPHKHTADQLVELAIQFRTTAHEVQLVAEDLEGPMPARFPAAVALDAFAKEIEDRAGARYVEEAKQRLKAER